MKTFELLSRQAQRRRLNRLGKVALAAYGLDQANLQFISDAENTVFKVKTPSRTYALRIHSPYKKPASEIEGELHWLSALRRETSLRVPEPVPTTDRRLALEIEVSGVPGPRPVVLFHWLPGRILGERINVKSLTRIGTIMGQLHDHATRFVLPTGTSRPPWGERRESLKELLRASTGLNDGELAHCIAAAEQSGAVIDKIDESQDYGLIHCDIHPWNCLLHQGQIGLIDFDDCRLGSFVEDIAITLTYFDHRPDYEALRTAFYAGYTQIRTLPPNYQTEVEAFMVSRGLGLICWIMSWPSPDYYPFGPDTLTSALRRARKYGPDSAAGI